jgi:predicted RNase H-like HicB family nuclease
MNSKYSVEFFWSDEDEGYIATVPDLPGCSAFGETRGEAAIQIEDAIISWLQAAEAAGNDIPQPSERKSFEDFSGKVLLRMTRELHRDLHVGAMKQGVSLNSYMSFLLSQRHYSLTTAHGIYEDITRMLTFRSNPQTGVKSFSANSVIGAHIGFAGGAVMLAGNEMRYADA